MNDNVKIRSVEPMVFRAPLDRPHRSSFGTMRDRAALAVKVTDSDGAVGWGEVFSNWPSGGAEHRATLIDEYLAPLLRQRAWGEPSEAFHHLTRSAHVLALQCGEPGPFASAICGLDIALWDLFARRAGQPLWRFLGGASGGALPVYARGLGPEQPQTRGAKPLPVYASGLGPEQPETRVARLLSTGYRAFKLRVGFGEAHDRRNLEALRELLGDGPKLMVDANQKWDFDTALASARALARFQVHWLEEPLRADTALGIWQALATESPIPLAAGENICGVADFDAAVACGAFAVLQPDVIKWGGLSVLREVARQINAGGRCYCPHYLGGGIGLTASAHLLAATGGEGMLEIDTNPNPLREGLAPQFPEVRDGFCTLSERPGLGIEPDLAAVAGFRRVVRV